jgi:predicted nucleotidyltransferase
MKLDKPIKDYTLHELREFIRNALNISHTAIHLTGSRYYGTSAYNSDYDFLILEFDQLSNLVPKYEALGFESCSSDYELDESFYLIMRDKNNINLIITNNIDKYEKRKAAAELCKLYTLPKPNVVAIHNALLEEGMFDVKVPF